MSASAQKGRKGRIKGRFPAGKDKIKCPILYNNDDVKYAIGLRIGEPIALTFKTFNKKKFSVEVMGGITLAGLAQESIIKRFEIIKPASLETPANTAPRPDREIGDDVRYISHNVNLPFTASIKFIKHFAVPDYKNLWWYLSAGADVRYLQVQYIFEFQNISPSATDIGAINDEIFSYGPNAHIGVSYFFKNKPLSAYAEAGMFYDVTGNLVSPRFIGGTGIRYFF